MGILSTSRKETFNSADGSLLDQMRSRLVDFRPTNPELATRVLSAESISDNESSTVEQVQSNLAAALSGLNYNAGDAARRLVSEEAAATGAFFVGAGRALASRPTVPEVQPGVVFMPASNVPNYQGNRVLSAEAYDHREQRAAVLYSSGFNYAATQQDDFNALFWPILNLAADQVGFGILVNRFTVMSGARHQIDGSIANFHKVDLVRAVSDSTVLHRSKTRVIPVARAAAAAVLVDPALVAPYDMKVDDQVVRTAPYRIGAQVNIAGLSQTDAQLQTGQRNQTDAIDPAISLEKVYMKVGDDIIGFPVRAIAGSNFTYAPQGTEKTRHLNFASDVIRVSKLTKNNDGSALDTLSKVAERDLIVRLNTSLFGTHNSEFATTVVNSGEISVYAVYDKDGNKLSATDADVAAIIDAFKTAKIFGYDLYAHFTNSNLAEVGQFVDTTSFTQLYEVPLLSPITARRTFSTTGEATTADFESLVATNRFRQMTDGVTALIDHMANIREYASGPFVAEDPPQSLGASRYLVKPFFFGNTKETAIDMSQVIDSLSSGDRYKDICASIVNILREVATQMLVRSEYSAAQRICGVNTKPVVIVGTSPYLHQYLMMDGELRTFSEVMDIRIVSTLDNRMRDGDGNGDKAHRVFMSFGDFSGDRNSQPSLLNMGNMIYAAEVVVSAPIPREGRMSAETIVQPRYRYVPHLAVGAELWFKGIEKVVNKKLPINVYKP